MSNPPGWRTPYPLPQDVAGLAQSGRCKNLGLWLDRYVAYEKGKKEGEFDVAQDSKKRKNRPEPDKDTLKAFAERHRAILADYRAQGYEVAEFQASPDWRVVIGLGGASVLETGLTTHRVYGFPYLPGSSVKGLARAYAELVAKAQEEILTIFGNTTQAGQVIFFDAIPLKISMELDIMNPHVAEYYQGNSPPADYLSPTPIYFLTIGKQSEFYFALAGQDAGMVEKACQWLCGALEELGAGGKTTAGYGTFTVKKEQVSKNSPTALPVVSALETQAPPLVWRRGKVRKFQFSRGELVDEETQEVFHFYQQNIEPKGWSPGLKMTVEYVVVEQGGHPSVLVRKATSYK